MHVAPSWLSPGIGPGGPCRSRSADESIAAGGVRHMMSMNHLVTSSEVRRLAGVGALARGLAYHQDGRVESPVATATSVQATHPLEAADVYEREALAQINEPSNHDYRSAVALLGRIRQLATAAGRPERFTALLDRVRTEHSRKTNLRKLLDARDW